MTNIAGKQTLSTTDATILFDDVIRRIKEALGLRFDADVARALDLDRRTLSGYKSRGTLPFDSVARLAAREGLSLEWLINDRGPMKAEDLCRVAEPSPRYEAMINTSLFLAVQHKVMEIMDECDIKVDTPEMRDKVARLVNEIYNNIVVNDGDESSIREDSIKNLAGLF